MKIEEGYTLAEEYVRQHNALIKLFPEALNTLRIATFLHLNGDLELLHAIIRIGFDKLVDNFDVGGIAVLVDLDIRCSY